jgi:hypothetical protein
MFLIQKKIWDNNFFLTGINFSLADRKNVASNYTLIMNQNQKRGHMRPGTEEAA